MGVYTNGESVVSCPISRLVTLFRDGYICNSMDEVAQSLRYFAANMPMQLNVDVWMNMMDHKTNSITSSPLLVPSRGGHGTNMTWTLHGQRDIPSVHYGVRSWSSWNNGTPSVLFSNIQDGFKFTSTPANSPGSQRFYEVYQY